MKRMQSRGSSPDMPKRETAHYSFPADLAAHVFKGWSHLVAGDYTPPALPNLSQLRELFETAYLGGMETDESRPLRFMLCCTANSDPIVRRDNSKPVESWELTTARPFSVQEIRRLAAVTDLDSSGIWVRFSTDPSERLEICGLVNLGRSWSAARNAFAYQYDPLPHALLVRVIAPGRMAIYQGGYCIGTLVSGKLEVAAMRFAALDLLGADSLIKEGYRALQQLIVAPNHEPPQEWSEFERLAYMNCILAIVNRIQLTGHGGALILKSVHYDPTQTELVRMKYSLADGRDHLQRRFVEFMNWRHQYGDALSLLAQNRGSMTGQAQVESVLSRLRSIEEELAQTCSFVGELARTDGAVVLNTDLTIAGFGTEIVLDRMKSARAFEVSNPSNPEDRREFDSEQKGMRHRSAIRLCAAEPNIAIFVVSQDGEVGLVWNQNGDACFKPGITTTSTNMVLA